MILKLSIKRQFEEFIHLLEIKLIFGKYGLTILAPNVLWQDHTYRKLWLNF